MYSDASEIYTALISHDRKIWRKEGEEDGVSFILIKYGEIGIKGKNRYIFEDALVRQIRYALQSVDGEFLVHKCHGRVYVDCEGEYDYEETVESLKKYSAL